MPHVLGTALTGPYAALDASATLHEGGLTLVGHGTQVTVWFEFPMIGRPSILSGDPTVSPPFEPQAITAEPGSWPVADLTAVVQAALADRLALVPTGARDPVTPLAIGAATLLRAGGDLGVGGIEIPAVYGFPVSLAGAPVERQLYDVAARGDLGGWHLIAPHALYHRVAWTDFGLAHITDMHVARRIDSFRGLLRGVGRQAAADGMIQWNDRFRGFVRYANYLHDTGVLDVIVATGDLYDFIYESDDLDWALGGNAAFLRRLVLGQEPGPEFPDVEELRVPIFMVPGNHDYRKHPYELVFDARVSATFPIGGSIGVDGKRFREHSGYRIWDEDAQALNQALHGGAGTDVRNLSEVAAARPLGIDPDLEAYQTWLASRGSYVVRLGSHRIAMIDSGPDVGVVDDVVDALRVLVGATSEDESTFVGGSPNCDGIDAGELGLVQAAIDEAAADGLVIVGLHAPLFNPWKGSYPYFLRQTQRPEQGTQVHGYLGRFGGWHIDQEIVSTVESQHPLWFPAENDHRPARFVKRVDTQDLLDYGVSRGATEELLALLAGARGGRAADVVLAGHTHHHNEFRVRPGWDGTLEFSMDLYTENPYAMYPTTFTTGWEEKPPSGYRPTTSTTYVAVVPGADPDQTPHPMAVPGKYDRYVQVPPYPTPLATAADPRAWWAEHRCLVLQTAALGPLESNDESFSGFRLLRITNDVIEKIHLLPMARLERYGFQLTLEEAVWVDRPTPYVYAERSRPLGSPRATGEVGAFSFPSLGVTDALYRDADGHLHELWRTASDRGTTDLTAIATPGPVRAAGDPSAFLAPADNLVVALYRGVDAHVHSLYWSTGAVGHDALSGPVGAPKAAGKPVGYAAPDASAHVFYRADGGRLVELWWTAQAAPAHRDLIAAAGAPAAAGDPAAYVNTKNGMHIAVYRGVDRHVHCLYWTDQSGPVGHDDLSGYAGSPEADGDPTACYTAEWDHHLVVYRSSDGHLHELWWFANDPVKSRDLTLITSGAAPAENDPVVYTCPFSASAHVVYRSPDGHVRELRWGRTVRSTRGTDLTVEAAAPLAASRPVGFAVRGTGDQHVFYRGTDDQVHEIKWSQPRGRDLHLSDVGDVTDITDVVLAGPANRR